MLSANNLVKFMSFGAGEWPKSASTTFFFWFFADRNIIHFSRVFFIKRDLWSWKVDTCQEVDLYCS